MHSGLFKLPSSTVPNPPTLTATPLYDSFGVLLEIESQAREGVGCYTQ